MSSVAARQDWGALAGDPDSIAVRARPTTWTRELALVVVIYGAYTVVRNIVGAGDVAPRGLVNARLVISAEQVLHLFHELDVQTWFLQWPGAVRTLGTFYGSAHFVVTAGALLLLYRFAPRHYPRWRNGLAATTVLALVGFAAFPLTPPRLLPASYGFVDTLATVGGVWSFGSGPVASVSNQYAAMPSLHVAWAVWSSLAIQPLLHTRPFLRRLAWLHPLLTVVAIVATGNHYLLDAVGALAVLGLALFLTRGSGDRAETRRSQLGRAATAHGTDEPSRA